MRKRFVIHIALLLAAVIAGMFLAELRQPTPATAQAPIKLKMQASWPPTSMFMDNFKMFAERIKKASGGRLEIETLPAGAVVPAFEVVDATDRGVIDGAHT